MTTAFALLVFFALVVGTAGAIVAISALIGRRSVGDECMTPYECGLDPVGTPRQPLSIKYFLIAVLFVIFDVEIVFFYPWATVYREMVAEGKGLFLFFELFIFVAILAIGLAYVWRIGALKWEK